MAKKVTVKVNYTEVGKLLKSKDLEEGLERLARQKSNGWDTDTKMMGSRVIASIYTTDSGQASEELDSHRIVGGL